MQCLKCGTDGPDDAKFCAKCGKRMPRPKLDPVQISDQPVIRQVDPVLKPKEAALLLKISRWKLDELRIQGKLPPNTYFEIPTESTKKFVRYNARELLAWVGMVDAPISTAG